MSQKSSATQSAQFFSTLADGGQFVAVVLLTISVACSVSLIDIFARGGPDDPVAHVCGEGAGQPWGFSAFGKRTSYLRIPLFCRNLHFLLALIAHAYLAGYFPSTASSQ